MGEDKEMRSARGSVGAMPMRYRNEVVSYHHHLTLPPITIASLF